MKKNTWHNLREVKRNGGAAMLIAIIFFLFISLAIISGLVSPTVRQYRIANDLVLSRQSFALSESGIEDVYYRLKNAKTVASSTVITFGNDTATTTISDSGYNQKTVTSLGDTSSRRRENQIVLNTGDGISFGYGVQIGIGGLTMGNGSQIQGSAYSNGNIYGSGSAAITGTAAAANTSALTADQTNGSGVPAYNVTFGDTNATQDFAQSFIPSTTEVVNKVDVFLRKVSTPSNMTVRIVTNNGGSPSTTTLASGSMSATLVSTTYGWVSVPLSSTPELTAGTTYWIVIDGSTGSASKYYQIGANDNGYANGTGKIGQYSSTWNNTTPSGLDGFFKLYLGGLTGSIDHITVGTAGVGNSYAHTITNSTIAGTNYCQTGSGNNKSCTTTLPDPAQQPMPISEQNILDWKAAAETGGTIVGDYTIDNTSAPLGPIKITGNLTIRNNAQLTMNGHIWVQGNLVVSNGADIWLASDYGESEGVIVTDGTASINQNALFHGVGSTSFIMVLSTSTSTSAITLENNGGAVILYAANGTVDLAPGSEAKALNGKEINIQNNAIIKYESGLANSNFVNGPSGGWGITTWKEIK